MASRHRRVFLSSALRRSCHLVVVILRAGMYDSTDMSEPGNLRGRSCRWLLMACEQECMAAQKHRYG
ncbi:hypothetical protein CYMTET_3616 [Cymbomonas tetramitiformis]|uniref:Secreted protein n=1 Tax=Cymbomonas tetramitiformis TaxID=36881 RepID=A0AAE0H2Y8_9CHLO|nr:hypothetical protein CYMTET_3616 [Cymbomonas tetramitiformis]